MSALLITLAIIAILAVGGFALRAHQQRRALPPLLMHAIALHDSALVVRDARGEWRKLGLDGALGDVVPLGSRARVIAYGGGVLWVAAEGVPLAAYRLPNITPVPAVESAVRGHASLGSGVDPRGRTEDGSLVVRGRDGRNYRVGLDGSIAVSTDDVLVPTAPWDESRGGRGQPLGVRGQVPPLPPDEDARSGYREGQPRPTELRLSSLGFVQPSIVMDWARGVPLALRGPDGYLVAHSDVASDGGNHRLSRVDVDGSVRWTVRSEELVGPTQLAGAEHRVLWVGVQGRRLVALAQAWRTEVRSDTRLAQRDASGEARLAVVDAATGAVTQRIELRR